MDAWSASWSFSDRALELVGQAVEDAIDWGARIVGLGSMTGDYRNHTARSWPGEPPSDRRDDGQHQP